MFELQTQFSLFIADRLKIVSQIRWPKITNRRFSCARSGRCNFSFPMQHLPYSARSRWWFPTFGNFCSQRCFHRYHSNPHIICASSHRDRYSDNVSFGLTNEMFCNYATCLCLSLSLSFYIARILYSGNTQPLETQRVKANLSCVNNALTHRVPFDFEMVYPRVSPILDTPL